MTEPTKHRLAAVLRERGLLDMALKAAQGVYDDYESELATPCVQLVTDLKAAGANDLAARAMNGEWDGTTAESEAWFEREGKDLLASDILDKSARRKTKPERPKPWRDQRPDAQAFDEVRITTVPRFKTSGLSGDEWRISAKIQFIRKGHVLHEDRAHTVETAIHALYWRSVEAGEAGKFAPFPGEDDLCDQEGCSERATVTLRKIKDGCGRCGHTKPRESMLGGGITIRRFCDKHKRRGDSSLDDSDDNYEPLAPPHGEGDVM